MAARTRRSSYARRKDPKVPTVVLAGVGLMISSLFVLKA